MQLRIQVQNQNACLNEHSKINVIFLKIDRDLCSYMFVSKNKLIAIIIFIHTKIT